MNINKYFKRINYHGESKPSLENLRQLQKCHLYTVPFENLDIHLGRTIVLNEQRIYDKIIGKGRGGFCYELNGLFYKLLQNLGYQVKRVSARSYEKKDFYSPEFDHLAIIVNIDSENYLVDVGYGAFLEHPLLIKKDLLQTGPTGQYLMDEYQGYWRVSKVIGEETTPEYIFKDRAHCFQAFSGMCNYHQTNINSHFMKKRLISIPTKDGRITLSGNVLKVSKSGKTEEIVFAENEFEDILFRYFKTKL